MLVGALRVVLDLVSSIDVEVDCDSVVGSRSGASVLGLSGSSLVTSGNVAGGGGGGGPDGALEVVAGGGGVGGALIVVGIGGGGAIVDLDGSGSGSGSSGGGTVRNVLQPPSEQNHPGAQPTR